MSRNFPPASRIGKIVSEMRAIFRPRLGGLPHLPGVSHIHVNMPLDTVWFFLIAL